MRSVVHHAGDFRLRVLQENLHARQNRAHSGVQIAHQTIHIFRRAPQLKEQQRQDHHLDDQSDRRDDAEKFEPQLHSCPTLPAKRRNPTLPPCRALRTSIRADTLPVPLPRPPRWNPSCAPPLPCCARSLHRRVPAVRGPSSGRNPCPHPPSSPENRVSLHRSSAQTKYRRALRLPAPPGNKSLSNPHFPPWQPPQKP